MSSLSPIGFNTSASFSSEREEKSKALIPYNQYPLPYNPNNYLITHVTTYPSIPIQREIPPPPKNPYFDEELKVFYYLPPIPKELLDFASNFYEKGEYLGIGISRWKILTNPKTKQLHRCDMLYFTKKENQIKYEQDQMTLLATVNNLLFNKIKKRQELQKSILIEVSATITQKMKNWSYEFHKICGTYELLKLGFVREDAITRHAIIFFYKQAL